MPWGPVRAAFLPSSLVWQSLFLMLFSVCCCCRDGMARALPLLLLLALTLMDSSTAQRDCRVSGFKVKENFDKTRVNFFLSWISDVSPSSFSQATKSGFSSTSMFMFSFKSHRLQYWETEEVCDVATPPEMLDPDVPDKGILQKLKFNRLVSNCIV